MHVAISGALEDKLKAAEYVLIKQMKLTLLLVHMFQVYEQEIKYPRDGTSVEYYNFIGTGSSCSHACPKNILHAIGSNFNFSISDIRTAEIVEFRPFHISE